MHASKLLQRAEMTTDAAIRVQLINEATRWADLLSASGSSSDAKSVKESIGLLHSKDAGMKK
jgi:hypothetical protein